MSGRITKPIRGFDVDSQGRAHSVEITGENLTGTKYVLFSFNAQKTCLMTMTSLASPNRVVAPIPLLVLKRDNGEGQPIVPLQTTGDVVGLLNEHGGVVAMSGPGDLGGTPGHPPATKNLAALPS